ncbi:glycosyltransferase [Paraglaciecola sp. L3A3]|uniref:glycosyltransferase family 2 protein n=1 Tax=Paraglaciecola sp. L3A3 TaxID=2686358 RepID=UPI001E604ECF|nr:glycosyltransferase [Paraglaciecola sp. L3A3]
MRKQLWLHNLYSKSLQRSGLFYGFPSPDKLQKLYVKNISLQTTELQKFTGKGNELVNIVIILSGDMERDLKSILSLDKVNLINTIYLVGESSSILHLEKTAKISDFKIKIENINLVGKKNSYSLLVIRSGDVLHLNAIAAFQHYSFKNNFQESVFYCDCDYLDAKGQRHKAEFYPDWNPDLQLSSGYIKTGLFVSGQNLVENFINFINHIELDGALSLWLASLYLTDTDFKMVHLPFTLVHQNTVYSPDWFKCLQVLDFDRFTIKKGVEKSVVKLGWNKNVLPLISLIIPTKNAKSLVKTCIESILDNTTYVNYEILLIDNNSDDPEAIAYFSYMGKHPKIRILSYPHSFNYSAINNFAAQHAKGDVIGLVNNDIEVVTPEWLTYMVGNVVRDDIGCVGAKLMYPDNRIQHAGVIMGYGGGAGHAHKYFPRYHTGYLNRLVATHNFSVVTAACLLVKKSDYLAVGGLNENDLAVAFNDVDFCLRVLQLGRRNLYCAEAILYHHESVSRGLDDTHIKRERFEQELTYIQKKWSDYIAHDPAYNPNLTLKRENFSIKE